MDISIGCEFSSSAGAEAAGRNFWPSSMVTQAAAGAPAQCPLAQDWLAWTFPLPSSAQSSVSPTWLQGLFPPGFKVPLSLLVGEELSAASMPLPKPLLEARWDFLKMCTAYLMI